MNEIIRFQKVLHILPIIAFCSLIFRSIIPFQLLLFFLLLGVYYFYFLVFQNIKSSFHQLIKAFKAGFWLFLIGVIYLLSLSLSDSNNPFITKEIFRLASVLLLFIPLFLTIRNIGLNIFIKLFNHTYLFYLFIVICILSYRLLHGESAFLFRTLDYNMLAMYFLVGIVLLIYEIDKIDKNGYVILVLYNIFLLFLTLFIVFSSSRRGVLGLLFVLIILLIGNIKRFKQSYFLKKYLIYISGFLIIVFIFLTINPSIRLYINFNYSNNYSIYYANAVVDKYFSILNKSDKQNGYFPKESLVNNIISRKLIKDIRRGEANNYDFYKKLHQLSFFVDSKQKLSEVFREIDQIDESLIENKEITLIPSRYNVDFQFENLFEPYRLINCNLINYDLHNSDSTFYFKSRSSIDSSLIVALFPISDSSIFQMSFLYYKNNDFPIVKILSSGDNFCFSKIIEDSSIYLGNNIFKKKVLIKIGQAKSKFLKVGVFFQQTDFYMSDVSWFRKRNSKYLVFSPTRAYLKNSIRIEVLDSMIKTTNDSLNNLVLDKRNIELNNLDKLNISLNQNRNVLVSDSLHVLYEFKPQVNDTILTSSRVERWKFAWFYFHKLPLHQKLFGDQLAYLDVYPKVFYSKNVESKAWDYPHNPIISSFLYSGIIGGLLYLLFLATVVVRFYKKRKVIGVYIVIFIITFFFAFFSGNSHFSIPLFVIVSFFPFFDYSKRIDLK